MIRATIQGKDKANNRRSITAQNAVLIVDEMAQKACINAILRDCKNVSANDEIYCELENDKFFCVLNHPEKDDIGRVRGALIVWDKNTSQELIEKTLEVMGLEKKRFLKLKNDYEIRQKESKNNKEMCVVCKRKNTLVVVGAVAVIAAAVYILLKN